MSRSFIYFFLFFFTFHYIIVYKGTYMYFSPRSRIHIISIGTIMSGSCIHEILCFLYTIYEWVRVVHTIRKDFCMKSMREKGAIIIIIITKTMNWQYSCDDDPMLLCVCIQYKIHDKDYVCGVCHNNKIIYTGKTRELCRWI